MNYSLACAAALFGAIALAPAADEAQPFLDRFALTIPGGGAGWLGVETKGAGLKASILWGGGSVVPVDSAKVEAGKLVLTRLHEVQRRDAAGQRYKTNLTETITATLAGDTMNLTTSMPRENGQGIKTESFTGKRIPALPPAPDLSQVKYGAPSTLFNGRDLTGWKLTDPKATSGWSAQDGLLVNKVEQPAGQPHRNFGNLRTEQEFEDFNLKLEARLAKNGNSGIYLRGIYEVQVADTFGRKLDPHNMGGIYSRICPTVSAEKPFGEWQTMDITLVNRHITVILNGTKIIDNQPVLGCTGGALWSDESRPGPIYLQGDHTGIEYRNIVLRPVAK